MNNLFVNQNLMPFNLRLTIAFSPDEYVRQVEFSIVCIDDCKRSVHRMT